MGWYRTRAGAVKTEEVEIEGVGVENTQRREDSRYGSGNERMQADMETMVKALRL
jgi:hypothetical protein